MQSKQIVVEVDESGNCSIDGQGFTGTECDKFLSEIENALGVSTKREKKPEYRQVQRNRQREKN